MRQLYPENGCLQRVEPPVPGQVNVLVLGPLAVVTHRSNRFGQGRVAGGQRSRVTVRAEVLARVKAEGGKSAHGSCPPSLVARPV